MKPVPAIAVLALAAACATSAPPPAAVPAPTPAAAVTTVAPSGTWRAQLALSGRSTYTGTVEFTGTPASLVGTLKLTVPVTVDSRLAGNLAGDSIRVTGPYSAGNGCTGDIRASLGRAGDKWMGPATLNDRCVGAIPATFTFER